MHKESSMILADVSFIDIFWSMLWFFFLFLWIIVLAHILTDLFRDRSLSGVAKTLWVVFLVFMPFLAALIYFLSRGRGMAERAAPISRGRRRSSPATFGASPPMTTGRPPSRSLGPRICSTRARSTGRSSSD
jgi:Phospholipase_D-nuclease N-terminal